MYLGYNAELKCYGILQGDLWIKEAIYRDEEFQALIDGEWEKTYLQYNESIKHSDGYYLAGHRDVPLERLTIRYEDERDNKIIY